MTGIDALVGGLIVAVISQGLLVWRAQAIIKNDLKHLHVDVKEIRTDLKAIMEHMAFKK